MNVTAVVTLIFGALDHSSCILGSILLLWLILLAAYLFLLSLRFPARSTSTRVGHPSYLPLIFCIYHLSFGLGFLVGFRRLALPEGKAFSTSVDSAWTRLTR